LKKREARSLDEEKTNTHATAGWWSRLEALSFRNDEPHRLNLINRRSFGREGATFTDESRTKRPRRNTNPQLPLRRRSWMRSSEAEERVGAFATAVLGEEQSSGGEEEQQRSAAVRSS